MRATCCVAPLSSRLPAVDGEGQEREVADTETTLEVGWGGPERGREGGVGRGMRTSSA